MVVSEFVHVVMSK